MSMSVEEIRSLAVLARLEFSPAELEALAPQFQRILGFVEQLSELDTESVEPMTTALDVVNCWEADEVQPSLLLEQALVNSPSSDGDCFLVPPVLGTAAAGQTGMDKTGT